jgi:antagonist of KipI
MRSGLCRLLSMSLNIRKPGILTTVQDLGRFGGQRFGINSNGVMDTAATRLINAALGNDDSDAVLEIHFPAPVIEFENDTTIAIGGADFAAEIDGEPVRNWSVHSVVKGAVLCFTNHSSGNRAYLAVRGGVQVDEWLGSRSTNLTAGIGGYFGRRLLAGDTVACSEGPHLRSPITIGPSIIPRYSRFPTVRVVPSSEFENLTATGERAFVGEGFTLTKDCNRMGYRLSGKPLDVLDSSPMVSAGVNFGTIQLLPDGQMIILMADHQTSGGYPRIGNVIAVDLPILAQCGPGDGVSFELVSVSDAEHLALEFEAQLNMLRVGCRLRNHDAD